MIPTRADDATHERYVSNIIDTFKAATPDQYSRGANWYPTAREVATLMAEGDTIAGAGVIAALSQQKSWELNLRIAEQSLSTGTARGNVGNAIAKAQRIMEGEDPLTVLPEDSKTWNFYRNIIDPTDPDPVTIDRHAHDVAVGEVYGNRDRGLSVKTRYATLAHAYREAARRLGEVPSTVQAVAWVVQLDATADLPYRAGRQLKS